MKLRPLFSILTFALVVAVLAFSLTGAGPAAAKGQRELKLSHKRIPDAVKATILAEILHDVVELEIMPEKEDGTTIFAVEYEFGPWEVEMEVTPGGRIVEKEIFRDDDEGDDEDDDDEDGDNGDDDDDHDEDDD